LRSAYQAYYNKLEVGRAAFRRRYPRRAGRRPRPFLENLLTPQTFTEWLCQTVRD
jgi:hypothetical protein